jgi:Fe-S-cluster containining protein
MADSAPVEKRELPKATREWLVKLQALKQAEAIRFAGHQFDEEGFHDEDECEICLLASAPTCQCRCGQCCRHLLIEVSLEDAKREPKIAERGDPMYEHPNLTVSGKRELIGYFLNSRGEDPACIFLDQATNLCTIYETRPLVCRLFDCDGAGRKQMVELGMLPPDHSKGALP